MGCSNTDEEVNPSKEMRHTTPTTGIENNLLVLEWLTMEFLASFDPPRKRSDTQLPNPTPQGDTHKREATPSPPTLANKSLVFHLKSQVIFKRREKIPR
jgi:hypothetical protein